MLMILRTLLLLFYCTALIGCSSDERLNTAVSTAPWAKHCTLTGIPQEDQEFWLPYANRCLDIDACYLACARNGCTPHTGGGCFHACNISSPGTVLSLASEFEGAEKCSIAREYPESKNWPSETDPTYSKPSQEEMR